MTQTISIRLKGGWTKSIPNTKTTQELAQQISRETGIAADRQEWLFGRPPRRIQFPAKDSLPWEVDHLYIVPTRDGVLPSVQPFPYSTTSSILTAPDNHAPQWFSQLSTTRPPQTSSEEGTMVRCEVPADNSCLFHAIAIALQLPSLEGLDTTPSLHEVSLDLRRLVANTILANPSQYNEPFLGRPTLEYAQWIQQPSSWGGQIELNILSQELQTQIVSLDLARNRHDVYGADNNNYHRRIFLLYNGLHYDVLACTHSVGGRTGQTMFSLHDSIVMQRALRFCQEGHEAQHLPQPLATSLTVVSSGTLQGKTVPVGQHNVQTEWEVASEAVTEPADNRSARR